MGMGRRRALVGTFVTIATLSGWAVSYAGDAVARHDFTGSGSRAPVTTDYVVIQFTSPPAASYTGGIKDLAPTRPEHGQLVLDTDDAAAYLDHLRRQHALYRLWLAFRDRRAQVVREYSLVFNGVAVRLNGASAEEIAGGPGVRAWAYTRLYRPSASDNTSLVKAPGVWSRAGGRADAGAGIRVGLIDTGIDDAHPSLACKGSIVHRVYAAEPGTGVDAPALDHGTSVAGVIGGCVATDDAFGTVSGVAPGAELWDYDVFPGGGPDGSAFGHDVLAALEDSIRDGMDVVNLSLGGYPGQPDFLAEAVDSAVDAGTVVTVAAGNLGPSHSTVESPGTAEKALTVGATTNGQGLGVTVTVSGRYGALTYVGAAGDFDPFAQSPAAGQALADWSSTGDADTACAEASDPTAVAGTIALVRSGTCSATTKIRNAQKAGAVGVIVYGATPASEASLNWDGSGALPSLPAIMVSDQDGAEILASMPASAEIEGTAPKAFTTTPDIVADFSSRGPTPFMHRLKPDVAAPGVNVYSPSGSGGYSELHGTSLAASHVAGVAALLRQLHPEWSPLDVKSALVNTAARAVGSDGVSSAGLLEAGAGRVDADAAARTPLTVSPSSASFGLWTGDQAVGGSRDLVVRNVSGDTLTCSVSPPGSGLISVTPASLTLAPGEEGTLQVDLEGGAAPTGDYEGNIRVACGEAILRVPWWLGVDREAAAPGTDADGPPPCADLVITGFTITPPQPVVGLNAQIDVTVLNQGTCSSLSFVVQWRSAILASNGPTTFVPGLGPGQATTVSFQYAFPTAGNYTTVAVADSDDTVSEFNESNNLAIRSVSVLAEEVDLQVSDFKVEPAPLVPASIPPLPVAGRLTRGTVTVKNQSNVPVGDFWVQWKPTLGTPPLSRQVNGLGGGASATLTFDYTYPADGRFLSLATVDPTRMVREGREFNNNKVLMVTVEPQRPDLEITAFSISPPQPVRGIMATAFLAVRNRGNTAAGPFVVKWTPRPGEAALARQVNFLGVGQSTILSFDHTYSIAGTFNSEAVVDTNDTINELDEGNNSRTLTVTVVPDGSDLVITAMSVLPGPPGGACRPKGDLIEPVLQQGANANVCITVTNEGNAPAGPFLVDWNPDTLGLISPSPSTLATQIDSLGAGQSVNVPFDFIYNQAGNFRTLARADAFDNVVETNEANNLRIVNVVVSPAPVDLVISSFSISPTSPIRGSKTTATITVANLGGYPTGPFWVQWKPTGQDAAGGPRVRIDGLNSAGEPNDTMTVQLDSTFYVAGPYTSWAKVDIYDQVVEFNELNNVATLNVTVQPRETTLNVTFNTVHVFHAFEDGLDGNGEWSMLFAVVDPNATGQCNVTVDLDITSVDINEDGLRCTTFGDGSVDDGDNLSPNRTIQLTLVESFPLIFGAIAFEADPTSAPEQPGYAFQSWSAADYRGVGQRTMMGQGCECCGGRCYDVTYTVQIVSEPPPPYNLGGGENPPIEVASLDVPHLLPGGLSQLLPPDATLPEGVIRAGGPYLPETWR